MSSPNLQNTPMPKPQGKASETIAFLKPYLWPSDRADLKIQVVWALLAMLVGKLLTVDHALSVQMGRQCPGTAGAANRSIRISGA